MITFVLILTLGYSSLAMAVVPSFYSSEAACVTAGEAWAKSFDGQGRRFKCLPGPDLVVTEPPRATERMPLYVPGQVAR